MGQERFAMSFGETIRNLRMKKKLSQDELGELLGINGRNVSRYEHNHVRPRAKMLQKMASVLGVPLEELQPPRPAGVVTEDPELQDYISQIDSLEPEDKLVVKRFLKAIVTSNKLQKLLAG
jgi:transcriptional regulator with XRE-family HTH domain